MTVVKFQDFWITGSRFYFKREDQEGVEQPLRDLGTIKVANPELAPEVVELEDSDGGIRQVVAEALTKIEEVYNVECNNLNLENLSMLFLSGDPTTFAQTSTAKLVKHYAHPSALVKLHDDDDRKTFLYKIKHIAGVYKDGTVSTVVLESINATTKTFKLTGDVTTEFDVGDKFIVKYTGLTDYKNAGTYTVVTSTLNSGKTDVVVSEAVSSTEASITGSVIYKADSGNTGVILDSEVDWDVYSLDRGIIRMNDSGLLFTTAGDIQVVFLTDDVSGKRLLRPQSLKGTLKGTGLVIFGRENNAAQTMREFECTITPGGSALSDTDFSSITFRVRVTSDLTADDPAGRMLMIKGALAKHDKET